MFVLDGVAALLDHNLLRHVEGADREPRFTMLETIREYALERLTVSGDADSARHRHARFFLTLAEQMQREFAQAEQEAGLESELDNFRSALAWLIEQSDVERAYRLWSALWPFWWRRGQLGEGRRWLTPLLANRQSLALPAQLALLREGGWLTYWQGDYAVARSCWEEVLAHAREAENAREIADIGVFLGMTAEAQGDYRAARSTLEASLLFFREIEDQHQIAVVQLLLGGLDRMHNNTQRAAARFAESLALHRQLGDAWHIATLLFNQGFLEQQLNNHGQAAILFCTSLTQMRELGDHWGISHCLRGLAGVAAAQNQPEQAARLFGATEALLNATGMRLEPFEQGEHDQHIAVARAQLDEAAFAAAWAEGRALSLEQAISEALTSIRKPAAPIRKPIEPNDLLSNKQWQRIAPLLPPAPRQRTGRPRMHDRQAMTAIFYALESGCGWKALPPALGRPSTVYDRFKQWRAAGVFERLWCAGLLTEEMARRARLAQALEPLRR
jgi:transposase